MEEEQPCGAALPSSAAATSSDGRPLFFFPEVLQRLTGHDEAGAPVALLLSPGMFQGVSDCPGPGCSTLLVSTAYDIQPPRPR